MNRRSVLKYLSAGAAIACPTCMSVANALASGKTQGDHGGDAANAKPHWTYEGEGGPEQWSHLAPGYSVCGRGMQQSPIDLKGTIEAGLPDIQVHYRQTSLRVVNNGHTIQANTDPGSSITLDGKNYKLAQFHFHHPSEHLVDGRTFNMEAHFVHVASDGQLAVLGAFIEQGAHNRVLAPIWNTMPQKAGPEVVDKSVTIYPSALLPQDRRYFRYHGSQTTPPCSEKVVWSIFKAPIEASKAQIGAFAKLFPMNARPPQGVHRRLLLRTGS